MAFRKRNVGLVGRAQPSATEKPATPVSQETSPPSSLPGVRASPVDGRPVTSTGTPSLDDLFAGHAGLALGNSVLIEESSSTDYAGTLLRYFAAEGVVQGHKVHVVGYGQSWGKELPGLASIEVSDRSRHSSGKETERMKIAWRYQKLGEFGADSGRVAPRTPEGVSGSEHDRNQAFCHSFDLTKRLVLPSPTAINYIGLHHSPASASPLISVMNQLSNELDAASDVTHRIIVPSLLSPGLYPPVACLPENILQFFKSLHKLLRRNASRACCMMSLPTALFPRTTGLTRWMELLSDGVIELIPFPHEVDIGPSTTTLGAATAQEEKPQGVVKVHRLPVIHERGSSAGNAGLGDDLAFTVTRKSFRIKPFSLPPLDGDNEAQRGGGEASAAVQDLEF